MGVSDAAGAPGKVGDGARGAIVADILGVGQRVIAGMRSTTGHGLPDAGESFQHGATDFLGAAQTLDGAYPRDEWEGGAAQTYTVATRRVAAATEALAVLDRDVHTVIDQEATQIIRRRETLDDHARHLASLRRATGSLLTIPGVGPAMTSSIELAAVTAAVGVCSIELHDLSAETADNARRLRRIAGDYEALIAEAGPIGAAPADTRPADNEPTENEPADTVIDPESAVEAADLSLSPEPGPAAPVGPAPMCPASTPVTASEEDPMQAGVMSGLTSAFGAVGGMVGAAVAPLAAVFSGVVTAAGQLPSPASQPAAPQVSEPEVPKDPQDEKDPGDPPVDAAAEPADSADAAPTDTPVPPDRVPSPPLSPPAPAATRPPQ
ncbi:hypothetical protein GR927_13780 [Mycolicibacterium sp. 3033]|nr:hypothetical protein [Mycolicibacterium aurantiacum]